jgi:hypothetical protein
MNVKAVLGPNGRAIVLVPQGPWNFGTLDQVLGHKRRYTAESLIRLADNCGLHVQQLIEFNRLGSIAWFLNGKLLRRRHFGLVQIKLLNVLTPLFELLDRVVPVPALSLIGVMVPSISQVDTTPELEPEATAPNVDWTVDVASKYQQRTPRP